MKIRFGKNDVLDTYAATQGMQNQITNLQDQLPMGGNQSVEKLLLMTLYNQATIMSGLDDAPVGSRASTVEAMTGMDRGSLLDMLEAKINMWAGE